MVKKRGFGLLPPPARLVVFIVLSTIFTFSYSWPAILLSLFTSLILIILGGKFPRPAIIACISAGILTFFGNALFAQENAYFTFMFIHISDESLLTGMRLGLRIMAMILLAIAFIAVTPLPDILTAFRGLRIPSVAEMYLTIVLRYVDILWYEIQISMKAMAMRGVNWEGSINEKIPAFRSLMMPLIFRILDHVDGQSLAIDNRGGVTAKQEMIDIPTDKPVIKMQDVYVRYKDSQSSDNDHALIGINMQLNSNETNVLLGRTGSGKTSLMLLTTGLIPHSVGQMRGDVELFGFNTKSTHLGRLGRMARIVLTSAVQGLVGLKVHDELLLSLRVSPIMKEEYHQAMVTALNSVGLNESFLDRQTLALSGGEMQRVALASAIVARPMLLALDDVTMQLDPKGKREVISALFNLIEGDVTTVISDASIDLLEKIGDNFFILDNGRLIEESTTLQATHVEKSGHRPPQLWRLGEAIGMPLPAKVQDAIQLLDKWKNTIPTIPSSMEGNLPRKLAVRAEQLTFKYPNGPTVIQEIDIEFKEGEFVAILGSNGSGKTTLALLLANALKPTSGQITIEGQPYERSIHRGYIGYVFQEPGNQMVTMKVSDEIAFGPRQMGMPEEDVKEAVAREIDRFGLSSDVTPMHLSPADARKVSIAATLSMNPKMIILDEPTNNLDAKDVDILMAHLKDLQAKGKTVVLITHDIEVALQYSERLVVISNGNILADGSTRQVAKQTQLLVQSDVVVSPVVELSLALWPDYLPALTVEEMVKFMNKAQINETKSEAAKI